MLNKKGFILIESLIVMSVLLVGMMLLYSNYNKIILNYGKVSYYDNVEDLYTAYYAYINRYKIGYEDNDFQIINVSDMGDNQSVFNNLNIDKIYYFKKSFIEKIYNEDNNNDGYNNLNYFDGSTINYLLSIKNKSDIDKCETDKEPCLTIIKFNKDGHYYFAKYEAYNVKSSLFKPRTTATTTTKPVVYSFANDLWSTIANNVRKGLGYKYNVGDEMR